MKTLDKTTILKKFPFTSSRHLSNHIVNVLPNRGIVLLLVLLLATLKTYSCTIVSVIAKNGHVWNANNEDGPRGVANFINVFPKTTSNHYGYYTLSYLSPRYGQGGLIQGGTNEAGLTFDFNSIPKVRNFEMKTREYFPQGDDAILPYLLAQMNSVDQVISFFEKYWFKDGFRGAQMHVADRSGNFAIISASGILKAKENQPLISTNFDLTGGENGSTCWRYSKVDSIVASKEISLSTMLSICKETKQKKGFTMYSNVQNLTTGEIWLFSAHNDNKIVKTTIGQLLAKGKKSYSFNKLDSLLDEKTEETKAEIKPIPVSKELLSTYLGKYVNDYIGEIVIQLTEQSILLTFADGMQVPLVPISSNTFVTPDGEVSLEINTDKSTGKLDLDFFENDHWSFSASKTL